MLSAMLAPLALSLWLAATGGAPPQTLWLTAPLYPGQDALVGRTEEALARLLPADEKDSSVVGHAALAKALQGQKADLTCLTGDAPCRDALDALVGGLGFARVVLIKGGNDASGYHFKVVTFQSATADAQQAESVGPTLDKALLSTLVKVLPFGAELQVRSTPAGATVFVDGEKVGVTPLTTQVLPGERVVKVDLPLHLPAEEHLTVIAKGRLTVDRTLERVPARITLLAHPDGVTLWVDGKLAGQNKVDRGIQPGEHTFRAELPGFVAYEAHADITAGQTYTFEKTLTATGWHQVAVVFKEAQEDIYARRSYFMVSAELPNLTTRKVGAATFSDNRSKLAGLNPGVNTLPFNGPRSGAELQGLSAQYGTLGRHFGVLIVGALYGRGQQSYGFTLAAEPAPSEGKPHAFRGTLEAGELRLLQPEFRVALWRFSLHLQIGLELLALHASEAGSPEQYEGGFWSMTLSAGGQGAVRFQIVEGFYVEAGYRYDLGFLKLLGATAVTTRGVRLGLGYAF